MAGASTQTQRVQYVNANWAAGDAAADGSFELLIETEDGERHAMSPSPAAMAALVALTQASDVMLWDPTNQTLIAANLVGQWLQPGWSAGDHRASG